MSDPNADPEADFFDRDAPDPKRKKPLTPLESYNLNRATRSGYKPPPLTEAQFKRRSELTLELSADPTPEREIEIRAEIAAQDGLVPGRNPPWVKLVANGSLPKPKRPKPEPRPATSPTTSSDPEEFERRRKASLAALDTPSGTG